MYMCIYIYNLSKIIKSSESLPLDHSLELGEVEAVEVEDVMTGEVEVEGEDAEEGG